ncbi:hypothetical protein K501DRAFT_280336 [Backusella circina FSU 941]|nr:hypothetical protein K501DRAFT_280336 [Backusella circina FSU 941]
MSSKRKEQIFGLSHNRMVVMHHKSVKYIKAVNKFSIVSVFDRLWPYITTNVDCFLPRKPIGRALLIEIICMLISFQKSKSFINRHRNMTGINGHLAENTISIDDKKKPCEGVPVSSCSIPYSRAIAFDLSERRGITTSPTIPLSRRTLIQSKCEDFV